mmetsp:Transcript_28651/g.42413  ORF Transcript_28651/g.42413 Transcript_28651/m.42413 type:complete len:92 (+) Transcript_28651:643-918(+)
MSMPKRRIQRRKEKVIKGLMTVSLRGIMANLTSEQKIMQEERKKHLPRNEKCRKRNNAYFNLFIDAMFSTHLLAIGTETLLGKIISFPSAD